MLEDVESYVDDVVRPFIVCDSVNEVTPLVVVPNGRDAVCVLLITIVRPDGVLSEFVDSSGWVMPHRGLGASVVLELMPSGRVTAMVCLPMFLVATIGVV